MNFIVDIYIEKGNESFSHRNHQAKEWREPKKHTSHPNDHCKCECLCIAARIFGHNSNYFMPKPEKKCNKLDELKFHLTNRECDAGCFGYFTGDAIDTSWYMNIQCLYICMLSIFLSSSLFFFFFFNQNQLNHGIRSNGEFNESNHSQHRNLRVTLVPFVIRFFLKFYSQMIW